MRDKLPLIPAGATAISQDVAVIRGEKAWIYTLDLLPIYSHEADDHQHFRLIIAQLVEAGACRPCEIVKTFGVTRNKVMRAHKQLREHGVRSFFERRGGRRTGTVLTTEKLAEAQALLDEGASRPEVAGELAVKPDTLRKAIADGRLSEPKPPGCAPAASSASQRSRDDAAAAEGMGTACTRCAERLLAAVGAVKAAATHFEFCLDVSKAGVLCALPALLANGLLRGLDRLGVVSGYYTVEQTLLTLALMFLCRIRTVEALRKNAPGELGKLVGLDRVPEARCLRKKMDQLAGQTESEQWAGYLSEQWLEQAGDEAGFLYVDGHVKVYDGKQKLPRRYVSRQRLCLRGISNYWINDALGCPFFVIERQIDDGLLQTLRRDIIPRLLDEVPGQPDAEALGEDPRRHRFVVVFDREGYSPAFFREMWDDHRIACITYRKNCPDRWALEEFRELSATMPRGEQVSLQLAERGTLLGKGKDAIWVKEIRKLRADGHQTAVIGTAYNLEGTEIAPRLFTRWHQENFFAYAMQHYPIDLLCEYGAEPFEEKQKIVNPAWRELERQRNSASGKLMHRQARFCAMDTEVGADPAHKRHEKWLLCKAELQEEIELLRAAVMRLAEEKKKTEHYICWGDLPETSQEQFMKLPGARRRLVNTIGMICYRAETALAVSLCDLDKALSLSDARALLQALFMTPGDLHPDAIAKTLEIHVHGASTPAANRRLKALFVALNETETLFPGTDLRMVFSPLSPPANLETVPLQLPPDQDI